MPLNRFAISLLVCLPLVGAASTVPAAAAHAIAQSSPSYHLYVTTEQGNRLQARDPMTLAPFSGQGMKIAPWSSRFAYPEIVTNASGSVLAATVYGRQRTVSSGYDIAIRVFAGGTRIGPALHPPVPMTIDGISPDGSQLYGLSDSGSSFLVLNARSGALVHRVTLPNGCCGPYAYDAAAARLYVLYEPPVPTGGSPTAPSVEAYDVATGQRLASHTFSGLMAGTWQSGTPSSNDPILQDWQPGFALSPDGRQLAILDGNSDSLTTIDTQTLAIEDTVSIHQTPSLLDRVTSLLGLAPTIAEAKQIEGTWLSMTYAPDGRSVLVSGYQGRPNAQGFYVASPLDLQLVDVATGTVEADQPVNSNVWGLRFAPDGSALYAVVPAFPNGGYGSILQRLDPTTLRVQATRTMASVNDLADYPLSASTV